MSDSQPLAARLHETFKAYWYLGFTTFGGPGVHVIILHKLFVTRLHWVDEKTFTDLFSISNALPGPGSTQLAFSIALVRNGVLPGLVAFLCWSIPGALGMLALGFGVRRLPDQLPPLVLSLLTGVSASAVGLIALAGYKLALTTITDTITRLTLFFSAIIALLYYAEWLYPVLVVSGGLVTLIYDQRRSILSRIRAGRIPDASNDLEMEVVGASLPQISVPERVETTRRRAAPTPTSIAPSEERSAEPSTTAIHSSLSRMTCFLIILIFLITLITLIVIRAVVHNTPTLFRFAVNLFIGGSVIFGGGPVVIPVLRGYTVDPGWVTNRDFLLGFAILQAFPGPNFDFSVFLGVLANPQQPVLGAILGYFAIFTPGILLKLALLPLYASLREKPATRSILRGLNASAVGLIFAAVVQLFNVGARTANDSEATALLDNWWIAVISAAFVSVEWLGNPPALAIFMGGLAGMVWYGVTKGNT